MALGARFKEVKTVQTFMAAAMDWNRAQGDGVHADVKLHFALATQLAEHVGHLSGKPYHAYQHLSAVSCHCLSKLLSV